MWWGSPSRCWQKHSPLSILPQSSEIFPFLFSFSYSTPSSKTLCSSKCQLLSLLSNCVTPQCETAALVMTGNWSRKMCWFDPQWRTILWHKPPFSLSLIQPWPTFLTVHFYFKCVQLGLFCECDGPQNARWKVNYYYQ